MADWICSTCGTEFPPSDDPPPGCPICLDERQYVNSAGQFWTTPDALLREHHNELRTHEPGLTGIGTTPKFAIGQRALLVQTASGNILWDCINVLDEATIAAVKALGGLRAIAVSHPHFYSGVRRWSRAFGNVPIWLHADDRRWVMRADPAISFWSGETQPLGDGCTLIRCGGHFPGGTVLHWPDGATGQGVLLTGDIIWPAADRRYVSFMYSYPNLIPLPPATVERIGAAVAPFTFGRIYGGWFDSIIPNDAHAVVARSVVRYRSAVEGQLDGQRA